MDFFLSGVRVGFFGPSSDESRITSTTVDHKPQPGTDQTQPRRSATNIVRHFCRKREDLGLEHHHKQRRDDNTGRPAHRLRICCASRGRYALRGPSWSAARPDARNIKNRQATIRTGRNRSVPTAARFDKPCFCVSTSRQHRLEGRPGPLARRKRRVGYFGTGMDAENTKTGFTVLRLAFRFRRIRRRVVLHIQVHKNSKGLRRRSPPSPDPDVAVASQRIGPVQSLSQSNHVLRLITVSKLTGSAGAHLHVAILTLYPTGSRKMRRARPNHSRRTARTRLSHWVARGFRDQSRTGTAAKPDISGLYAITNVRYRKRFPCLAPKAAW